MTTFPCDLATVCLAIVFLPLVGAVLAGLLGRMIGDKASQAVTCALVLLSALLSAFAAAWVVEDKIELTQPLLTWIHSGTLLIDWGIQIDTLTVVMFATVTAVSAMVHLYSIGYMAHEQGKSRFMAYLSLFTFFMLMLVCAPNLLQMFFGWEGVGLMSYLLINFWYERPSANDASMKAFLVNRVGDFGFLLGILGCFVVFGSIDFRVIFAQAPEVASSSWIFLGHSFPVTTSLCLLLFMGAMGKSAQLGLHTWLPDAMEGPTPVSALIHAATMVTAGVFMVARMSPLFEYAPGALAFVTIIGALTCVFAAVIGLTQFDIKRVIAYSTMSQLGYMFFAAGVSAYSASIFHLMTHAFFKSLLFLGAGSVIHVLSGEQDMRKMGALWRVAPVTYSLMLVGALALAGIGIDGLFGFAGFYSKDLVLNAALANGTRLGFFAYALGIMVAFMTAFYTWRLLFLTFHGAARESAEVRERMHESSWVMLAPLFPLALGAVVVGAYAYDWFGPERASFWGHAIFVRDAHDSMDAAEHVGVFFKALPMIMAVLGILLAFFFYIAKPSLPGAVSAAFGRWYRLVYRKFYIDELYAILFIKPARFFGEVLWKKGDDQIIDGFGPDGFSALSLRLAKRVSALQTGYIYHYAFAMILGVAAFVSWFFWGGTP
ncbi:MAG: NADH-quinone oxidoreductase subunit L [Alphaproteobacteria bacterium]|nr:NADH-quinone oxidoreductase subunit L [Alphaproteobacteria bacterium]